MRRNPARIDTPKTASGPESSFSLTRQAQTNRYDRRIDKLNHYDRRIGLRTLDHTGNQLCISD
jgi:hypothetical protein